MWTKEKPTIDGWYWFRPTDEDTLNLIKDGASLYWPVEILKGELFEDGLLIDWDVQGEYQGPIKPEGI